MEGRPIFALLGPAAHVLIPAGAPAFYAGWLIAALAAVIGALYALARESGASSWAAGTAAAAAAASLALRSPARRVELDGLGIVLVTLLVLAGRRYRLPLVGARLRWLLRHSLGAGLLLATVAIAGRGLRAPISEGAGLFVALGMIAAALAAVVLDRLRALVCGPRQGTTFAAILSLVLVGAPLLSHGMAGDRPPAPRAGTAPAGCRRSDGSSAGDEGQRPVSGGKLDPDGDPSGRQGGTD